MGDFLAFPAVGLPQVSGKTRDRDRRVLKALRTTNAYLQGALVAERKEESPPSAEQVEESKKDRASLAACFLARLGFFSRAVRRLLQKIGRAHV